VVAIVTIIDVSMWFVLRQLSMVTKCSLGYALKQSSTIVVVTRHFLISHSIPSIGRLVATYHDHVDSLKQLKPTAILLLGSLLIYTALILKCRVSK